LRQSLPRFPSKGLRLWLGANHGVEQRDGRVTRWTDQSGNGLDAHQPDWDRCPVFLPSAFNGRSTLRFDGEKDYLILSPLDLNGWEEITLILVSANWRFTKHERWGEEGGPHGTCNAALLFDEEGEGNVWGSVYLSPFQNRVSMRIGTGQEDNVNFWIRPESKMECPSISVAVKCGSNDELYVDGKRVATFEGKYRLIANTSNTAWLGRGRVETYGAFDISEILIYDRTLAMQEIDQVFRESGRYYSVELFS
jgi:hypothetical protein